MSGIDRVFVGNTTIAGIAGPVYTEFEQTASEVANAYLTHISVINDVFSKTTPLTSTDATNVQAALAQLSSLAQNGMTLNSVANLNVPPIMKKYFLTQPMAANLDLLIRSFQAVGASNPGSALNLSQLQKWKDLSVVSPVIQDVLSSAINAIPGNRSMQSILELNYVTTGNDLIAQKLADLETALSTTNQILTTLSNLQDIRNRLVVNNKAALSTLSWKPGTGGVNPLSDLITGPHSADYVAAYRSIASAYFTPPLAPSVSTDLISGTTLTALGQQTYSNLIKMQSSLLKFITNLSAISSAGTLNDPNSLYGRLKQVRNDFIAMLGPATNVTANQIVALKKFLLDGNDPAFTVTGKTAGDAQQNLTSAVTAGQGLNDQQKQVVSRYLFVFEEFYKSAAAMLQRLSQMIEKMAQNISR